MSETPDKAVILDDSTVLSKGRRTGWTLFGLSVLMGTFCLALMATFAAELAKTVGDGGCQKYSDSDLLKENWCKCGTSSGNPPSVGPCNIGGTVEFFADTYTANACPNACSGACNADSSQVSDSDAVASWKAMLTRFDKCRANVKKVRECLPTEDTDGQLANYRGQKFAHPSLSLSATSAFIQRDAFLDACDAQATYVDRRERGGVGVLAMICLALVTWIVTSLYVLRKPNYAKYPRETIMQPLTKIGEKFSFNHRYHPDSMWLWYSSFMGLFVVAVQLYSFYTPTTTDIRIPIVQGVWVTVEIVTRGFLFLLDKFTVLQASSIFFDIGFAAIGFSALMEPFFEPKITTKLPEVDESVTDYALAIRVLSFVYPLIMSAKQVKDLYVDNYWPAPATAHAMAEKKRSFKRTVIKLVLLGLQLGAACSVYGIMGDKTLCHQFRTCARTTCEPNIPHGAPLDGLLINSNKGYRQEMISEDGIEKWRWGINSATKLKFLKSSGKLYADVEFAVPNGAIENDVSNPGGNGASGSVGGYTPPTQSCGTRFEIQCQEVNPRHAFEELTGTYEWVKYNTSSYKLVATHDYEQTSGDPSCFSSSTPWGPTNAMFMASDSMRVGGTVANPDLGYVLEENSCDEGGSYSEYCLIQPPYVAVYAAYGRSTVPSGSLTLGASSLSSDSSNWYTSTSSFNLNLDKNLVVALGSSSSSGGSNTGGANTGGANTGGANTGGANTGGSNTGGGGGGCTPPPCSCSGSNCPGPSCSGTCTCTAWTCPSGCSSCPPRKQCENGSPTAIVTSGSCTGMQP